MPPPSKIDQLPPEVRSELDRRLIANGFGGFVALSDWLSEQGFEISKSAVGLRGQRLKRRLAAVTASTEAMKMVAEAAPDDSDERSNAIISLLQTDLFEALVEFQEAASADDESIKPADRIALYSKAAKNIATLTRASVARNKWAAEVRKNIAAMLQALKKEGFDTGTLDEAEKRISIYLPSNGR
jgi:hypothetical protein